MGCLSWFLLKPENETITKTVECDIIVEIEDLGSFDMVLSEIEDFVIEISDIGEQEVIVQEIESIVVEVEDEEFDVTVEECL